MNKVDNEMKRRCLFIDRDGTLIAEPPDEQVDEFSKVSFLPGVFIHLSRIAGELDYELVLVTNQDGLGTDAFPEDSFWPVHNFIMETLKNEGIVFSDILIDRSFEDEGKPTRKPGTGMMAKYFDCDKYDLERSWVIGDRESDIELAGNLGCGGLLIRSDAYRGWKEIADFLFRSERQVSVERYTSETKISLQLSLDGGGESDISSGIGFFDHMLDQISRHAGVDLKLKVKGDLHVDEHHTVEDTALVLGEAFRKALGNMKGVNRYGFELPMDESRAKVLIDFGGRPCLVWDADFRREQIGSFPTELFSHFFKSFSDSAGCNLHIEARGSNEHHKIEAVFKSFARALRMAVRQDFNGQLPSTKGMI